MGVDYHRPGPQIRPWPPAVRVSIFLFAAASSWALVIGAGLVAWRLHVLAPLAFGVMGLAVAAVAVGAFKALRRRAESVPPAGAVRRT